MKKINFLKSIAVAAMFMVAGNGAYAQLTIATAASEVKTTSGQDIDYVTKGSVLQYKVDASVDISHMGITNLANIFKWEVYAGTTTTTLASSSDYTLFGNDGTAATLTSANAAYGTGNTGYYDNKVISVGWQKEGDYTMSVNEKLNLYCASSTSTTQQVTVLPWPSASFATTDISGCGLTSAKVPLASVKGSISITVAYKVDFKKASDGTTSTLTTPTPVVFTNGNKYNTLSTSTLELPVDISGGAGVYTVTITNITDNVTNKCFTTPQAIAADLPAAPYVFNVIPSPTTAPIQHVKNL